MVLDPSPPERRRSSLRFSRLRQKSMEDSASCILVVGSTGSGKSSTVAKCTGQQVRVGHGCESVTKACHVYQSLRPDSDPMVSWVDTVGWEDLDGDDVEIFQSILRLLNRHNLTQIKAVIWTVNPGNIRQSSTIHKQAKFINQFAEKQIWNNTIIICKQAMNPEQEAKGAMNAGYEFNATSKLQVLGYRFIDDPTMDDSQRELFQSDEDLRKRLKVFDDKQVAAAVQKAVGNIRANVQILFNDYRCLDCGCEGDRRLLSQFCHMERELIHRNGKIEAFHPQDTEPYHPSTQYISEHPGRLKKPFQLGCCSKPRPQIYSCCKREADQRGCKEKWACCRQPLDEAGCKRRFGCCKQDLETGARHGCASRYSCCQGALDSRGCKPVCRKCGMDWGTEAGKCFKKEHNLIERKIGTSNGIL